jgi:drug/metabolite transporter (DMT)-like permease
MPKEPFRLFDVILLVVLIVFWGSSFVVVKFALREGLTPFAIATFRFLVAGALFLVALLVEKARNRNYSLSVELRDVSVLVFLGLTGITLFFAAQYTGNKLAGASIAAILVCLLSPILITSFSAMLFKEKLSRRQILGISVAALGTLAVTVGGTLSLQFNTDFPMGSLILLATPVLWTAYSLTGKKTIEKYSPFLIVAYVNMLGGILLVPFSLAEGSLTQALTITATGWLAILYLAVTCSLIGYYIWLRSIKIVGAAITSSFLFAEPLVTVTFAVTLLEEQVTAPVIVGALLILTGVYLITKKQNSKKNAEKAV